MDCLTIKPLSEVGVLCWKKHADVTSTLRFLCIMLKCQVQLWHKYQVNALFNFSLVNSTVNTSFQGPKVLVSAKSLLSALATFRSVLDKERALGSLIGG